MSMFIRTMRPLIATFIAIIAICGTQKTPRYYDNVRGGAFLGPLYFPETDYDFGEVWKGDIIEHAFTIENTSDEEVWISVKRSGWGTMAGRRFGVPPRSSIDVPVVMSTKNLRNRITKNFGISIIFYAGSDKCRECGYMEHTIRRRGFLTEPCHAWSRPDFQLWMNEIDNFAALLIEDPISTVKELIR